MHISLCTVHPVILKTTLWGKYQSHLPHVADEGVWAQWDSVPVSRPPGWWGSQDLTLAAWLQNPCSYPLLWVTPLSHTEGHRGNQRSVHPDRQDTCVISISLKGKEPGVGIRSLGCASGFCSWCSVTMNEVPPHPCRVSFSPSVKWGGWARSFVRRSVGKWIWEICWG